MKTSLFALPVLLCAAVVAVPSPTTQQTPLNAHSTQHVSRWRGWSDRLIGTLFSVDKQAKDAARGRNTNADRLPPPHTLERYAGDVVLRFSISTPEEAKSLAEAADTLLLDVWEFSELWVDIRLSKDIIPSLLGLLPASLQHSHSPLLHERDLAQAIFNTYPASRDQPMPQTANPPSPFHDRGFNSVLDSTKAHGEERNLFFQDYQPLSVIYPWMRFMSSFFSSHTRMVNIGTSYEGREILGLRVGVHPTNNEDPNPLKRKTILITGGLHAREWIATSTVCYIAFSLITGYGKTRAITTMLETFDVVLVPTLNPDGFVYTWDTDRLWRKNRQATNVRFCPGIDLDRGFGFEWDAITTAGNPCSENFAGEQPFEAVESLRLADWAKNETEAGNVDFVSFLDLHSYSQEILYPYSYSCDDTPAGQEDLEELAIGLNKAIRLTAGHNYEVMAACEGNVAMSKKGERTLLPKIEEQGGSALDWFYRELKVRFAYQIKLRDRGTYGFLLPKENIMPVGREIFSAVMYMARFLTEEVYGTAASASENEGEAGVHQEDEQTESTTEDEERPAGEEIEAWIEDGDWVIVEDVDEPQIELRRRRKR